MLKIVYNEFLPVVKSFFVVKLLLKKMSGLRHDNSQINFSSFSSFFLKNTSNSLQYSCTSDSLHYQKLSLTKRMATQDVETTGEPFFS